ncbi:MAG TPA: bifunctional anthranilate synthase component II/anthranilate phosphoribosyltransferase [bacterium]|nr:bifunctional anthranilate synthase component II/anthranilate phosphoribosyltransferase [bacterium]HPN29853.1 bifunctional anthranilate synthase component II/anthranilate phosphoribosyltransferase [bacterium]
MILLIDNYDSFVYNLYQYVSEFGYDVQVFRNDKITLDEIAKLNPSHIIISPGPGRPENAGIICDLIKRFHSEIPILGICLGHQAIGYAFGGKITNAKKIMHGKSSRIFHNKTGIFSNLNNPFSAVRYHSLVIEYDSLPEELEITAHTEDGTIMGIRHKKYQFLQGIQFHPESILTEEGKKLLLNFFNSYENSSLKKNLDLKEHIKKAVDNINLNIEESVNAMRIIMSGNATPSQIAAFMTAMRLKGETIEEITGFAKVMREKASKIPVISKDLVDTCGTGGDMSRTFNISTCSAFAAAGAGVKISKHGNRSVSSHCGSADILSALGVNIDLTPEQTGKCIDEIGIGFLFAPKLHGAMKYAMTPRKEMGIRTVFNILGPLCNPSFAEHQVLGVYDKSLTETLANVLKNLGSKSAFIVHGCDGLDEITLSDYSIISELKNGVVKTFKFNPVEYGFHLCAPEDLKSASIENSVEIFKSVLDGKKSPKTDIVIINAAFAILLGLKGVNNIKEAIELSKDSIYGFKAKKKLEALIEFTKTKS